jgi:hypothetical protein
LKQDENHVQHPQEQNDRDSSYLHRSPFHPFDRAKPRLSRRGREARLRVNLEQALAFRPGSRKVHSLTVTFTVPGPLLPWLLQLA